MGLQLPELNLPPFEADVVEIGGQLSIFDPFRGKYVVLTPEEWVRQHFARWLVDCYNYPRSLVANEIGLNVNGRQRRADTVVFSESLQPLVVVEYKNAEIHLTQKVFDQIVRYNMVFKAPYLIVSNGMNHYCCHVDFRTHRYAFLRDVPKWEDIQSER